LALSFGLSATPAGWEHCVLRQREEWIRFSYPNEDTKDEERRKGWVGGRRLNVVPSAKRAPCSRTTPTTLRGVFSTRSLFIEPSPCSPFPIFWRHIILLHDYRVGERVFDGFDIIERCRFFWSENDPH
jgi:hypothetical protein